MMVKDSLIYHNVCRHKGPRQHQYKSVVFFLGFDCTLLQEQNNMNTTPLVKPKKRNCTQGKYITTQSNNNQFKGKSGHIYSTVATYS